MKEIWILVCGFWYDVWCYVCCAVVDGRNVLSGIYEIFFRYVKYFWDTKIFLFFSLCYIYFRYLLLCHTSNIIFCVQLFVASNDLDVLPRIL